MRKFLFLLLFWLVPLYAAQDLYQFKDSQDAQRFFELTTNLRCLVCQNQNIAESNASLASDLRDQVYKKMAAGESNQEILDYLTARYSSFILYEPPFNAKTLLLWVAPFLCVILGASYLFYYVTKRD